MKVLCEKKFFFVCKLFVKILDIYVRGSSFLYKHSRKISFSITEFFSKYGQIRSFLRIWTHLLLKVNNANIKKVWNMFRINSKVASTTLMAYGYSVWIVDIKHISLLFLVFLLFIRTGRTWWPTPAISVEMDSIANVSWELSVIFSH